MELDEYIAIASKAYDEHGFPDEGDTLATFIQQELGDVFDPEVSSRTNAQTMWNALATAIVQLSRVQAAIGSIP